MFRLFICSFGSVFDSNEQINICTNTRLVNSLVSAIVRYYLKKNPSTNKQKGFNGLTLLVYSTVLALRRKWGFMLYTCAHSLDHVNAHDMTTNLKWSFFWMTLRGTLIPTLRRIAYAHRGLQCPSSETQARGAVMYWSTPIRLTNKIDWRNNER